MENEGIDFQTWRRRKGFGDPDDVPDESSQANEFSSEPLEISELSELSESPGNLQPGLTEVASMKTVGAGPRLDAGLKRVGRGMNRIGRGFTNLRQAHAPRPMVFKHASWLCSKVLIFSQFAIP